MHKKPISQKALSTTLLATDGSFHLLQKNARKNFGY
jgi:hypothetical protein